MNAGNVSTGRWAGYLGNLTSTGTFIFLANAAGTSIFYNWSWDTAQEGEVCAGQSTSYTWSGLAAGTAPNLDTAWGFADASDDAEATFTDTQTVIIGGITITGGISAATGAAAGDTFETNALVDVAGSTTEARFIFCTPTQMSGSANAYDGTTADYEIIVPTTYGGTETYYFYTEMN